MVLKFQFLIVLIVSSRICVLGQDKPVMLQTKTLPIVYHQHAAEYRALCHQAFNLAALRLEQLPKRAKGSLPPAIITDIDETILDNSSFEAQLIKDGKEYSFLLWKQWTDQAIAPLVPGAGDFLKLAKKKDIRIFYISNRDTSELSSTLINLKNHDLPDADLSHLIFQNNESSKEARRARVMEKYNVVLLIGDNLNDFMAVFERKDILSRASEVDKIKEQWGKRFIVIPNVVYGEWENAFYDYQRHLTTQQKNEMLMKKLIGY